MAKCSLSALFVLYVYLVPAVQAFAGVILCGAGATFPYPLYEKWIMAYEAASGDRIIYRALGSGAGISQLLDRAVDFGATDAFLDDKEERQAGAPVLHMPTCVGAVAIIYHLPTHVDMRLSPDCLADIFLGRIRKWSDERIAQTNKPVRLPDLNITVVHRSDSSGTSFILTDYLSRVSGDWRHEVGSGKTVNWPTGLGVEGNEKVAEFVARIPGSIGFVQLNYAHNMNLPFVAVRNRAGLFIKPTLQSCSAAAKVDLPDNARVLIADSPAMEGYPISAFTYLIFYKEQRYNGRDLHRARALARFLWWSVHEGQQYNEELFYSKLPKEAVDRAEQIIQSMTYDGKPVTLW